MVQGYKRHNQEHRQDLAGEYKWGDTGQIILLLIFMCGIVADVFIFKLSELWQHFILTPYRLLVFIPLIVIAGYFIQKSQKIIFQEQRDHLIVIKTDVYAHLRHPMYFGSIMIYLAFVILTLSLVAFILFLLITGFYYYISRYEELLLIEKLGTDYKQYMKFVPMLFPRLRK